MNTLKVSNFWIKELIFILIMYFKNLQLEISYFTIELQRNLSKIILLLKMRKKYDVILNKILTFKQNLIK